MNARKANVLTIELDQGLDVHGFFHTGTGLGGEIGAERIGAAVYETDRDAPIWPYHYHHGVEEWLYVISGAPVLREAAGSRALAAGDLVCFPCGHVGAHTVHGPGRFVIFSTGGLPEASVSVYPDSDKLAVGPGITSTSCGNLDRLIAPRDAGVGYWHGEGTAGALDGPPVIREPEVTDWLPVVNVLEVDLEERYADVPAGFHARTARLAPQLGASRLGASVAEMDPGEGTAPYHYECGREEWVLVLSGTPTLRTPDGEEVLEAGDLVCFPDGPAGAHRLINRGDEVARLVFLSTMTDPSNIFYPDSGKWFLRNRSGGPFLLLRETDAVDYWDGEV